MRLDETIALAALIQATVAKLYKLHSQNQGFRLYRRSLIMENKWRAARYGIDGKLIDFGKQMEVPERELIEEYLEFVDDVLDELDSREEVEYIRQILKMGTGADRQLAVYQKTGDMKEVVDYIIEETEVGIDEDTDEIDDRPSCQGRLMSLRSMNARHSNRQLNTVAFRSASSRPARATPCASACASSPTEKVTLITDEACLEIAAALVHELEHVGCALQAWVLEDVAPRPLTDMPQAIAGRPRDRARSASLRCRRRPTNCSRACR